MILHITDRKDWENALQDGKYITDSLESEGFIHCSTTVQVIEVANYIYKGKSGLVLLCIDSDKVDAKIVYEDLYNTGKLYPHIYGELNIDSVTKVINFEPDEEGYFSLPNEVF